MSQLYGHVLDVVLAGLGDGAKHADCDLCREVMSQAQTSIIELRKRLDSLPTRAQLATTIAGHLADPSEAWELAGLITATFSLEGTS